METANTILILNKLVTINNDRIEGYKTASEETKEEYLKTFFLQFISTSQKCRNQLMAEINKLGGEINKCTMMSGKFFRVWMDVKGELTAKDLKLILDSCEFGEDAAEGTYEKVLRSDLAELTPEQQILIKAQYSLIQADHNKVKSLRDSLITA